VIEPGKFDVMVGASSAHIRERATLEVAKKWRRLATPRVPETCMR
jgi:hypothetical protein